MRQRYGRLGFKLPPSERIDAQLATVFDIIAGGARKVRGRGVARALKLETVLQAIALGVRSVRTENDGENAPILHLTAQMGYARIPGWLQCLRDASG